MILSEIKTVYIPDLKKQILFDEIDIEEYLDGNIVCYLKDVLISGEVLERLKHLQSFNINIYGFRKKGNNIKLWEKEMLEDCKLVKVKKTYRTDSYINLEFKVGGITENDYIWMEEYDLENILKI